MPEFLKIDANKLDALSSLTTGQSFILVEQETNRGLSIDYDILSDLIINKILVGNMPNDGMKFVVVE